MSCCGSGSSIRSASFVAVRALGVMAHWPHADITWARPSAPDAVGAGDRAGDLRWRGRAT